MNFLATCFIGILIATTSLFASASSAEARCTQQCYRSQGYVHCRQHCVRLTCPAGYYIEADGRCYPHILTCPTGYYFAVDGLCYPLASTYTYSPSYDNGQEFFSSAGRNDVDLGLALIVGAFVVILFIYCFDDDQSDVIRRIEQAAAHEWQQAQYVQEQTTQARAAAAQLEYHIHQERQRARALGYQQG